MLASCPAAIISVSCREALQAEAHPGPKHIQVTQKGTFFMLE